MSTKERVSSVNVREVKRTAKEDSRLVSQEVKKSRLTTSDSVHAEQKDVRFYFNYEESTSTETDNDADLVFGRQALRDLKAIVKEISELRKKPMKDENHAKDIEDLRREGTMLLLNLKKVNRVGHFRCKKGREITLAAKHQIDQQRLQLHNLLYEAQHFQREIQKCLEFKSQDEELRLIGVEEFYSEAPVEITNPDITRKDLHQQTLGRLDYELDQRKKLTDELEAAKELKENLEKEFKDTKTYLEGLQPKLATILQATKPVQEYLQLPLEEKREQTRLGFYLPRPLYVLYRQTLAYSMACDKEMTVRIEGDIENASASSSKEVDINMDSDSEHEEVTVETPVVPVPADAERHRRHSHTINEAENVDDEELVAKTYQKHPLNVTLVVTCPDGSLLKLTFEYLSFLKFVTVTVSLKVAPGSAVSPVISGDLLAADVILSCLYPGDVGLDSPNPTNRFVLQKLGLSPVESHIPEIGFGYHWVQWLCGIRFFPADRSILAEVRSEAYNDLEFSASHIEATIERLRLRVTSRVSLHKQLVFLEKCAVDVLKEYKDLFPPKIVSRLVNWKKGTHEDYVECPFTQHVVETEFSVPSNVYYTALVERGSAQLTVQILIPAEYPRLVPIFCVQLKGEEPLMADNCIQLQALESEINVYFPEMIQEGSRDYILSNQIQRLLMCFDIFLESRGDPPLSGPTEFARDKLFSRSAKGPARLQPLTYNAQLEIFTQR